MTFTSALLQESRESWQGYALSTLALSTLLSKFFLAEKHKRHSATLVFFLAQFVLLLLTALLASQGSVFAQEARIAHRVLLSVAWVGTGGVLVFGVLFGKARLQVTRIVEDLVVAVVTFGVVVVVLQHQGVELSGFFATSALVTAVIGFSLQDTLGNTMGGLALQTDGSISVGDWVRIGDVNGRVVEMRWRYTAIENRNGETILVPNGAIMKGVVTIVGRRDSTEDRFQRRWVKFNVDFRHPPSEVIDAVLGALRGQAIERVAHTPPPDCIMFDLQESYAVYAVRYWLTELRVDDPTDSAIRTRIIFALKRAGIGLSIPAHAVFLTEESKKRKLAKTEELLRTQLDALKKVSLFQCLQEDEFTALARQLQWTPFSRGEALTKQGAEAHWLYLVTKGDVAVRVAKDEAETEVARIGPGDFFGEMSLMTGARRSATVVALTDVECYRLNREAFQQLVQTRPEIAGPIATLLAERQANLVRVNESLDAEVEAQRMAASREDIFHRMRAFLGLN